MVEPEWAQLLKKFNHQGIALHLVFVGTFSEIPDLPNLHVTAFAQPDDFSAWLGCQGEPISIRETVLRASVKIFMERPDSEPTVGAAFLADGESGGWLAVHGKVSTNLWKTEGQTPDAVVQPSNMRLQQSSEAKYALQKVCFGESPGIWFDCPNDFHAEPAEKLVGVLSGSFNPLHAGHRKLRDIAERILKGPVGYEMSLTNADKPPLDFITLEERNRQFDNHPVWLTNAPTFVEKARIRPGTTFVLGADTAERIIQPRFYQGDHSLMIEALQEIHDLGCRFFVGGRFYEGVFRTLESLAIPDTFRDLFQMVSESEFREDISSTALRRGCNAE